jgi:hypothetical protein
LSRWDGESCEKSTALSGRYFNAKSQKKGDPPEKDRPPIGDA